jgi:hypothetical protein
MILDINGVGLSIPLIGGYGQQRLRELMQVGKCVQECRRVGDFPVASSRKNHKWNQRCKEERDGVICWAQSYTNSHNPDQSTRKKRKLKKRSDIMHTIYIYMDRLCIILVSWHPKRALPFQFISRHQSILPTGSRVFWGRVGMYRSWCRVADRPAIHKHSFPWPWKIRFPKLDNKWIFRSSR